MLKPSHHNITEKFVVAILLQKTTICAEDTIHTRRHKETRNSSKYYLLAPTSTLLTRKKNINKNTKSVHIPQFVTRYNICMYILVLTQPN